MTIMSRARLQLEKQRSYDLAVMMLEREAARKERDVRDFVWLLRMLPVNACGCVSKATMVKVKEAAEALAEELGIRIS